jgi:type IV secretory pathway VirB9-like protein
MSAEVWVSSKAVDEECGVYIVLYDSVVRVVAALGDSHTAGDEILNIAT